MDNRKKYVIAPRDLAAAHCRSATVIETNCQDLATRYPQELPDHGCMYISSAILRAFSIELALKSLYYSETTSRRHEHNLETLFKKLTSQSQAAIAHAAEAELARPFLNVLSEIADVFRDWRYVHEKLGSGASRGFDTDEMKHVAHAVLQVLDDEIEKTR